MTPRDLTLNRAEIFRVVATGNFDFASARAMLWAMHFAAAGLGAQYNLRLRRARVSARKPNNTYQVPLSPLSLQSYTLNPTEVVENTKGTGRGYTRANRASGLEPSGAKV